MNSLNSNSNSTQPQKISDDPNLGTPEHEWVSKTTGAVDAAPGKQAAESVTRTGGKNEVPGGYPGETDDGTRNTDINEVLTTAQKKSREAYIAAEQTAKEYYPVAQQKAQSAYATAEQAAREYLPAGVLGTLEKAGVITDHHTQTDNHDLRPAPSTLPTQETGAFYPSHGGVGMLPGSQSEQSVAKLPEERLEDLRTELPSRENGEDSFKPTHGGVGTLPGGKDEEGVALLPDERNSGSVGNVAVMAGTGGLGAASEIGAGGVGANTNTSATATATSASKNPFTKSSLPSQDPPTFEPTRGGVGMLPGDKSETSVAKLPEERNAEREVGSGNTSSQYKSSNAPETHQPHAAGIRNDNETTHDESNVKHKGSLLQRIKGEAKIIGRKVTGDKSKVEGKDIKSGNV